jgi:hypothetical protein
MINSFRMRVASSVFPGACVRCGEFRFDVNIAAHAVGTLGSLGRSRRSVLVVCPEYLDELGVLGAVSRVAIATAPSRLL